MLPIDVLFLIEHVDRELDAVTCIVDKLERNFGITAEVRNYYSDMLYCMRQYEPRIVVTPFFYSLNEHPIKDYVSRWPNSQFINMAWEQILYKMNQTVKIPKDDFSRTRVKHICWTRQYKTFIQSLGVPSENLLLTGNPVMSFYDAPYSGYFRSRTDLATRYRLDPSRKWVLFPENYRWAFLSQGQIRSFIQQDADPAFLEEARTYCLSSFRILFEWLEDLNGSDDPIVIVRPRPATSAASIEHFLRSSSRNPSKLVKVIKGESAREWVLASDHVITSYSTSLIEAALARKPLHVFSPLPFPGALADEWYAYASTLSTRDDFLPALRNRSAVANWKPLEAWARERLLPRGDALDAIAAAIGELHAKTTVSSLRKPRAYRHLGLAERVREKLRKRLQRSAKFHKALRKRDPRYAFTLHKHEKDIFGADDVRARVDRWSGIAKAG